MADKSSKVSYTDDYAIYHEVSPNIVLLLRFFNCLVIIMIVISFVLCFVNDSEQTFYLLACNTAISLFCGCVMNWWYRQGDLGPEKYWYIFLLGVVIIFQCVTTDMYVFRGPLPSNSSIVSPATIVPATRISINATTRFTPHTTRNHTTKPPFLYMTRNPFLHH